MAPFRGLTVPIRAIACRGWRWRSAMPDETCRAFDQPGLALDRNTLNRFVVGADPAPRKMTKAEIQALGDPFAALFAKGKIPRTAQQSIDFVKAAAPAGDPLREQ